MKTRVPLARRVSTSRPAASVGDRARSARVSRIAVVALIAGLAGSIVACDVFVVGERAVVYNATQNSMYYVKNPNSPGWAGSTTKILTLYTALWAISNGHASLNDEVAISQRAQAQACQCLEWVPDGNGGWQSGTVVGERFLLSDLLVGIAWSAGEATDAVAEHIAAKYYHGGVPASSVTESEQYMRDFLSLSNFFALNYLGATDTWQASVHGGNSCDFSIGCYDQNGNWCASQSQCDHHTTARDLAVMWKNAAAFEPMFIQILGFKNYTLYSKTDPNSEIWNKQYPLMNRGGWYPGWQGDKNGSGGTVAAQATRCGRTIVAVSMNANNNETVAQEDVVRLFDDAYEYFCNLAVKLEKAVSQLSWITMTAASDGGEVASATVTDSDTLEVTVWTDSSEAAASSAAGIEVIPSPGCTSCDPEDLLSAAFLGDGMLATAVIEWDKKVRLSTWSVDAPIGAGPQVAHVADFDVPGLHETARLLALDPFLLLLATRDEQGSLSLRTYAVDQGSRQLVPLSESIPGGPTVTTFEIAGGGGGMDAAGFPLSYVVLASVENPGTDASVSQWEVQPSGVITHVGDAPLGDVTGTSITRTGAASDGRFVTAAVGGSASVGAMQLHLWRTTADGPELIRAVDASEVYPTITGATALTPIANGGPGGFTTFHHSVGVGGMLATTWHIPDSGFDAPSSFDLSRTWRPDEPAEGISAVSIAGTDEMVVSSRDTSGQKLVVWKLGRE